MSDFPSEPSLIVIVALTRSPLGTFRLTSIWSLPEELLLEEAAPPDDPLLLPDEEEEELLPEEFLEPELFFEEELPELFREEEDPEDFLEEELFFEEEDPELLFLVEELLELLAVGDFAVNA